MKRSASHRFLVLPMMVNGYKCPETLGNHVFLKVLNLMQAFAGAMRVRSLLCTFRSAGAVAGEAGFRGTHSGRCDPRADRRGHAGHRAGRPPAEEPRQPALSSSPRPQADGHGGNERKQECGRQLIHHGFQRGGLRPGNGGEKARQHADKPQCHPAAFGRGGSGKPRQPGPRLRPARKKSVLESRAKRAV